MRLSMILFLVVLLGVVSGVSANQGAQPRTSAKVAPPPASTATPKPKPVSREVENKHYAFTYAYPAAAAAIPALKARLDADMAKAQREIASIAAEGAAEARADGRDFNPYSRTIDWAVVTALPGWLSLSGSVYEFSGGAHGNTGSMALLWDKAAGRVRDPLSLFLSREAFDAALRRPFCAALNKERAIRREAPVDPASDDEFDACLEPSQVTVLLGSSDRRQFNRIGLIADPYAAGPYVEGSYDVTLPVTAPVLKALRPEFRAAFALGR